MSNQPVNKAGRCGFTLAEILVVVLIMGIAAAVVIPMAVGTGGLQAVSAARMISADLQYAQNLSITQQTPISVVFDASAESYGLYNASNLLEHPINKNDYLTDFSSQGGFGEVDIDTVNFGGTDTSEVTFDELGSPVDGAGWVTITDGQVVYRVDVTAATGMVTVTDVTP